MWPGARVLEWRMAGYFLVGSEFQFSKVNKFLGVDVVKALGVLHTVKLII